MDKYISIESRRALARKLAQESIVLLKNEDNLLPLRNNAVAAGNDVIMPGGPPVIKQVLQGYQEGRVTLDELRRG